MNMLLKSAAFAALIAATPALVSPAAAQVAAGQGTAVLDMEGAIGNSAAFKAATAQIQTTYKPQIDAYNTRAQAIEKELAPAQQELQTLQNNPATPKATLDAKVAAYRSRLQTAQAELGRLSQAFARPTAYAREQIEDKLEEAIKAAMVAKKVNLVVRPETLIAVNPGGNITPDVVAQLDATVKTVSVTPPANWQPGQQRPAGAAAAAPAGVRPPAAATGR